MSAAGQWCRRFYEEKLAQFFLSLTIVTQILSNVQESQRHEDIEDPVDAGGAGIASTAGPEWVDLRVYGPGHGTHPCNEEELVLLSLLAKAVKAVTIFKKVPVGTCLMFSKT